MIFFFGGIIILAIKWGYDWGIDYDFDLFGLVAGIVCGIFAGGLLGLLIAVIIGCFIPQTFDYTKTPLLALKDNISIHGSFFLGSGQIDSTLKYFYFKEEAGGYKASSTNAETSLVYEDEESKPYLKEYTPKFENENFMWIAVPTKTKSPEFHIPKNSILSGYKLDLN